MRRNISAVNYEEEQRPELVMEDKRQAREQLIFLEAMFKYWSVTESVFREGKKRTSTAENVLALTQTAKSKWENGQAGKWVLFCHFELQNIAVYYTHQRFIQMSDYLTYDASKPNKTNVLLLRVATHLPQNKSSSSSLRAKWTPPFVLRCLLDDRNTDSLCGNHGTLIRIERFDANLQSWRLSLGS